MKLSMQGCPLYTQPRISASRLHVLDLAFMLVDPQIRILQWYLVSTTMHAVDLLVAILPV